MCGLGKSLGVRLRIVLKVRRRIVFAEVLVAAVWMDLVRPDGHGVELDDAV